MTLTDYPAEMRAITVAVAKSYSCLMLARKRANASESQIQTVDALLDQTVAGISTKSIDCERYFTYFNILGCGDEI